MSTCPPVGGLSMRSMRAANFRPATSTRAFLRCTTSNGAPRFSTSSHSRAMRARRARSRSAKRPSSSSSFTAAAAACVDGGAEIFFERGAVFRRVPDALISSCTSVAALSRRRGRRRAPPARRVQAVVREGAERARGLVGEHARAAAHLSFAARRALCDLRSVPDFLEATDRVARVVGKPATSPSQATSAISGLGASSRSSSFT